MSLTIKRTAGARSVTLQLQGDLDLATAPELAAALESIPSSYGRLVLDLSKLGFIDSAGGRALVGGKQDLTGHGVKVDLFDVPRQAAKVLQLLGLDRLEPRGA